MTTYLCPKGHVSTEPDYCSECGLRIAAAPAAPSAAPAASEGVCPVCATPRTPGARYCEVCRYDFGAANPVVPLAPAAPPPAPPPPPAAPPPPDPAPVAASPLAVGNAWAIVTADKSLMGPETADLVFPEGEPRRSYPLDLDENLVGRRTSHGPVHPEIPANDPSVSSRHLKICRRKDGSLYLVDVGSRNGTRVNGAAVEPGVETPLSPGDQIAIGAWTRIVIETR
jgi:hypothetical protein